jgi:hypothetical protein
MSQHDYNIANAGGAAVRADINNALLAILSSNSGATAPSPTAPYMVWFDTSTTTLKVRNAGDTAWVDYASGIGAAPLASPTFTGVPSLPTGTIGVTQSEGDATTKLATTAFVDRIRSVPTSSNVTAAATDRGKSLDVSANVTIPSATFSVGDVITITNTGTAAITIALSGGTSMYLAGTATTGTRTLAQKGVATARMYASGLWTISGAGLT